MESESVQTHQMASKYAPDGLQMCSNAPKRHLTVSKRTYLHPKVSKRTQRWPLYILFLSSNKIWWVTVTGSLDTAKNVQSQITTTVPRTCVYRKL